MKHTTITARKVGLAAVLVVASPLMAEAQMASEGASPAAAAPGAFVVDEDEVIRALERALVLEGAQVLAPGVFQIQQNLSYTRDEARAPFLFPLDGGGSAVGERQVERDVVTTGLTLRAGLPYDSQVELTIPYSSQTTTTTDQLGFSTFNEESDNSTGFGDIRVGVSKALVRERAGVPSLIGGVYWDTDSGSDNLGSGFDEVGVSLTAVSSQDPLVFIGGVTYDYALENADVQPGGTFGFSAGMALAVSPETSWRVALEQSFQREARVAGRGVQGSDETFGVVSLGVSTILAQGTFLDVTANIGLTDSAPDYSLNISLPIRLGAWRL